MGIGRFMFRMVGKLIARPVRRRIAAFHTATRTPLEIQQKLLQEILSVQANTAYGRDHAFSSIQTIEDYRRQVPINPYENLAPYIQRMMKGETDALVSDPKVLMFALTSGTTAARKHIPITQAYLDDYRRGWNIWGLTAMREHPAIKLRPVMQLVGDPEEYRTEAGIPCGNLSGFTAQVQKRIIRFLYSVPAITGKISDAATRYYLALRFSIPRRVGMLSAANPSTLVALARVMDLEKENLIRDIAEGTLNAKLELPAPIRELLTRKAKKNVELAKKLEEFVRRDGALLPSAVWPSDSILLGCWTGGSVGPYLRQLPRYYADTPVRDIGLLASEGRFSIPLQDSSSAGVLDITSHYYEFIPEREIDSTKPLVLGAHELQEGGSYYILPTTKSGLYRYHISDLIRVTGFHERTPLIEFLGKGNRFANLTGEKLSEHHVTQAMDRVSRAIRQPVSAYTLAPCWDDSQPFYGLFLEESDVMNADLLRQFVESLDRTLGEQNIEYAAKRVSGRLGPVRVEVLPTGSWQRWDRERLAKSGGSAEQYKHPCLIGDVNFKQSMPVMREIAAQCAAETLFAKK
ncbi:MAG: GH3 auxin-responsive promoter family protein [Planctomycetes bacterium]|nr:GH3 auxin-responsive promoter family protein [Planctomycetota bacterium]